MTQVLLGIKIDPLFQSRASPRQIFSAPFRRHRAIAARVMRQVLVDYARTRSRAKRGGGQHPVGLDEAHEVVVLSDAARDEILALDSALQALDALDPRQGQIVECRYFGGLTVEETAEALGISAPTVKREWRTARLFLLHHLAGQEEA